MFPRELALSLGKYNSTYPIVVSFRSTLELIHKCAFESKQVKLISQDYVTVSSIHSRIGQNRNCWGCNKPPILKMKTCIRLIASFSFITNHEMISHYIVLQLANSQSLKCGTSSYPQEKILNFPIGKIRAVASNRTNTRAK